MFAEGLEKSGSREKRDSECHHMGARAIWVKGALGHLVKGAQGLQALAVTFP